MAVECCTPFIMDGMIVGFSISTTKAKAKMAKAETVKAEIAKA